jgi:hypothetical protein
MAIRYVQSVTNRRSNYRADVQRNLQPPSPRERNTTTRPIGRARRAVTNNGGAATPTSPLWFVIWAGGLLATAMWLMGGGQ